MRTISLVLCALVVAGCGAEPPRGVALSRVTTLPGACAFPDNDQTMHPDLPRDLEFERYRGPAAFEGGSRFGEGNVIALAWEDKDGALWRLQLDVGPKRGYLASMFGHTEFSANQQAMGLVGWKDGVRIFGATNIVGVIQYVPDESLDRVQGFIPRRPGTLFLHVAFTGRDEAGAESCRLVAVHALAQEPRDMAYDPAWLTPNPTAMVVEDDDGQLWPTFERDTEPSDRRVPADEAGPDPGGPPPVLPITGPTTFVEANGGGNACG